MVLVIFCARPVDPVFKELVGKKGLEDALTIYLEFYQEIYSWDFRELKLRKNEVMRMRQPAAFSCGL